MKLTHLFVEPIQAVFDSLLLLGMPLMWSVFLIIDGLLPVWLPIEMTPAMKPRYLPNPQWG